MNRSSLRLLVLASSTLALGGCGTLANFATLKPKVYGGLVKDAQFFSENGFSASNPVNKSSKTAGPGAAVALGIYLALVPTEFCLTAVADTMTLPITMALDPDWPPDKD